MYSLGSDFRTATARMLGQDSKILTQDVFCNLLVYLILYKGLKCSSLTLFKRQNAK
jgi:hypothetical protein